MPKTDWMTQDAPSRHEAWRLPPQTTTDDDSADDGVRRKPVPRSRGTDQSGGARARKHFVEPYPYTDKERNAIARALTDCQLGDATAREIFIGAIAYDLAVLKAAQAQQDEAEQPTATTPPKPPARQRRTSAPKPIGPAVAEHALALLQALESLNETTRRELLSSLAGADPFRRGYGPDYLAALGAEIERVATAAAAPAAASAQDAVAAEPSTAEPQPIPARTKQSPRSRQRASTAEDEHSAAGFIRHAASVYEQCFDARPAAEPDAPFARVLEAIAKATGIAIPTDATLLQRALRQG